MKKSKQDKIQEEVKKLALLPENRVCMDCGLKSTPYVVPELGIFVCSFCAGIHREFQRRAVGITVTNFKEHELNKLKNMGNEKAKSIWRATWNPQTDPKPTPNSASAIKDFIYKTYTEKRWYKPATDESDQTKKKKSPEKEDTELPPVQSINKILPDPPQLQVEHKEEDWAKFDDDDFKSFEKTTTQESKPPQQQTLDLFFSDTTSQQKKEEVIKNPKENMQLADILFQGISQPSYSQPSGYSQPGGYPRQPYGGFGQPYGYPPTQFPPYPPYYGQYPPPPYYGQQPPSYYQRPSPQQPFGQSMNPFAQNITQQTNKPSSSDNNPFSETKKDDLFSDLVFGGTQTKQQGNIDQNPFGI